MRGFRGALAATTVALTLGACTLDGNDPVPVSRDLSSCPNPEFEDIRGLAPSYVEPELTAFTNDDALCGGQWLPRLAENFTVQGLAVRDENVWVSGNDGAGGKGRLYCWLLRLDRRTSAVLDEATELTDPSGTTGAPPCRHGGGLVLDDHGLWLAERVRLWLLDPETLEPVRTWQLSYPVQGSFGVLDDQGRLGLGDYKPTEAGGRRPLLHWFDLDTVLAGGTSTLGAEQSVAARRIPHQAQGALWATLGGREGLWLTLSNTRCGILSRPDGSLLGFVPGAEGLVLSGHSLFVSSESTARPYALEGGRPVVPSVSRLDARRVSAWAHADCSL